MFLEAEHADETSWAWVDEERRCAIESGGEPPRLRIYREAPPSCPLDLPLACRLPAHQTWKQRTRRGWSRAG